MKGNATMTKNTTPTDAVVDAVVDAETVEGIESVDTATGEIVAYTGADADRQVAALNAPGSGIFTTFTDDSFETKLATFSALNDADQLADHLGKTIKLTNIVAQSVMFKNEAGEMERGTRTVLIDEDGKAYAGMSQGLYTSVQNILAILGHPSTWPGPFSMKVVNKQGRNGFKFFTIVPVS